MDNKIIIESLVMDLKRVSLGYHRGSIKMAERFLEEARLRKDEVDTSKVKPYIKKLLQNIDLLADLNSDKIAEDSQMLSTLFQNYIRQPN